MTRFTEHYGPAGVMAAGFALCLASFPQVAAGQDADALATCQLIEDSAGRLECYDAVLKPAQPAPADAEPEPAVAEPAPAPAAEPKPEPAPAAGGVAVLDDTVGKESVTNESRDTLAVRGRLDRCQKGRSGKYVFWFENGQVWRQKGSATPNWKECNFDVMIGKDMFGYTMTRVGESRKYRIERVE